MMNKRVLLSTYEGISNKKLDWTLRSFWKLESLGIEEVPTYPACDHFASTLQVKDEDTKYLSRGVNTSIKTSCIAQQNTSVTSSRERHSRGSQ